MTATKKAATGQERAGALRKKLSNVLSFARLAGLVTGRKKKQQPKAAAPAAARRASAPAPAPTPMPIPPARQPGRRDLEAEGRRSERARWAAIIQTPEGRRNLTLAVDLATQTDLTAAQAIAVLAKTPVGELHPDRAARNPRIAAAGDVQRTPEEAAVARMDRALKQANPSTRRPTQGA